jgi:hypothetical protein
MTTLPCPEGLSYFPYQSEGIEFALQRPGTLLGDEMGTGKTIQTCGLINALSDSLCWVLIDLGLPSSPKGCSAYRKQSGAKDLRFLKWLPSKSCRNE